MKKIVLLGLLIIVIINLPPTKWITGPDDILYSNAGGTFTFDEANYSGRDYDLCMENFSAYKLMDVNDTILYRVTPINILKIWRWADYLVKEKYKLNYKSWKEIEAKRGPITNKSNCQAF